MDLVTRTTPSSNHVVFRVHFFIAIQRDWILVFENVHGPGSGSHRGCWYRWQVASLADWMSIDMKGCGHDEKDHHPVQHFESRS